MAASIFLSVSKDESLYPFNVLRNEETLHFGVRSIANQWHDLLQAKPNVVIHPRLLPTSPNVAAVMALEPGQAWTFQGQTVAQHGTGEAAMQAPPAAESWRLYRTSSGTSPRRQSTIGPRTIRAL